MIEAMIIGCGQIAGGYDMGQAHPHPQSHAGAMRAHGGFTLSACVEPDAAKRAAFMAHWGVLRGYASLAGAIDAGEKPAAVSICSPDGAHLDALSACLALRPRAVLCEKPLGADPDAAEALLKQLAAQGATVAVNFSRRFDGALKALAGEIAQGQWGAALSAAAWYVKGIRHNGSHMIDLLSWLLGPLNSGQVRRIVPGGYRDDPTVDADLSLANGAPVRLFGADPAALTLFEAALLFERGRIDLTDRGYLISRRRAVEDPAWPGYRLLDRGAPVEGQLDLAMMRAIGEMHAQAVSGGPSSSPALNALATERLTAALAAQARGLPGGEMRHE